MAHRSSDFSLLFAAQSVPHQNGHSGQTLSYEQLRLQPFVWTTKCGKAVSLQPVCTVWSNSVLRVSEQRLLGRILLPCGFPHINPFEINLWIGLVCCLNAVLRIHLTSTSVRLQYKVWGLALCLVDLFFPHSHQRWENILSDNGGWRRCNPK